MPRPNWFFAFPVQGDFVLTLPAPPPKIRMFHPEDVHLTLSFLGGCGEEAARRALAALDESLRLEPVSAIEVSLSDVVPMGRARPYSALSALLARGRRETEQLLLSLRDVPSRAALGHGEARAPKPHVTIARPERRASDAERESGRIWARGLNLHGVSADLDRIALYTWNGGDRSDRLFRVVAELPLSRPA